MTVTKQQVTAYVRTVVAVAEAIRELGSVPSGHLYAQLMTTGMSLENYQKIIDALKGASLVKESNHLLTWVDHRVSNPTECLEAV